MQKIGPIWVAGHTARPRPLWIRCNSQKYTYLQKYTPGMFSRTIVRQIIPP